ncbi:nuclear transport factor 2 family protein [Asticcacaulis benevestitus]|nr:nuclear transport factor 2 family protein [Asticcacaulis benevestitus]
MSELPEIELLPASIERVWNERNDDRRLEAIKALYAPDCVVYEPGRPISGHEAMSKVVAGLLGDMPSGFRFETVGPIVGHHGVSTTRWQGGTPGNVTLTGADVIRVKDGLIVEHYFFFDPKP